MWSALQDSPEKPVPLVNQAKLVHKVFLGKLVSLVKPVKKARPVLLVHKENRDLLVPLACLGSPVKEVFLACRFV